MPDETTPPEAIEVEAPNNEGLVSALQKERAANKELRSKLKALQQEQSGESGDAMALAQERERALSLEKQAASLKAQLEEQVKGAAIRQAFFDAGGRRSEAADASFLDLVAAAAMKRVQVAEDGTISVTTATGGIDIDPATNKLRDLRGLMAELAGHPVFGVAFEPANKASGSGLTGRGGEAPMSADDIIKMSPPEMITLARQQKSP